MNTDDDAYTAGICNIGKAEIRRRWIGGWGGGALTAAVWAGLAVTNAAPTWYWFLALPALGAAMGFVQARSHFCVHYGLRHMFNFSDLGSTSRVEDTPAIRLDRRRSWQLIGSSVSIAFAVAVLGVLTA
jgi:hypothetical protein